MATLTLQPSAVGIDTYIDAGNQTTNFGSATNGSVAPAANTKKFLIKFDISSIPANAVILSATLRLYCESVSDSGGQAVDCYRGLVSWVETQATWQQKSTGVAWVGGNGGTAGNDYASSLTISTGVSTAGTTYDWNVLADVSAFFLGTATNNGWWLLTSGFRTKTFSTSDHATAAQRPALIIHYRSNVTSAIAGTSTVTAALSSTLDPSVTELVIQPNPTAGKDTQIRNVSTTSNYGISTDLTIGYDAGLAFHKAMIQMSLASIPSNAIIYGAFLGIYVYNQESVTPADFNIRRALTDWFEGAKNGAVPDAGQDGSTWNLRNANGSVAWGTAGGLSGTDYELVGNSTDQITIYGTGSFAYFDVTSDIISFHDGSLTNRGWWLLPLLATAGNRKIFYSSDFVTASQRPKLVVYYVIPQATISGSSSVQGVLKGKTSLEASISGSTSIYAQLITNFFSVAHIAATSSVSGTLRARGTLKSVVFGDSTTVGDIKASYHSVAHLSGTSVMLARLKGKFEMEATISGLGLLAAVPSFEGQIRSLIQGISTVVAVGYARAANVANVIGCNPVPLFYITNGSIKPNGQLNILNFLGERAGYFLVNYSPQIAQYKDSGYWSSSPQSNGRRLRGKVFENAIDIIEVSARAGSQDALIQYQQDLLDFQEAASDYWASDYAFLPYYLVARAARETNIRYALIHMISCPELENPFTQPFFDDAVGSTFVSLTIRIEHGMWLSTPPGRFDCVAASGQREWTVSGWQVGS